MAVGGRMTEKRLQELQQSGKIKGWRTYNAPSVQQTTPEAKGLLCIKSALNEANICFVEEYRFSQKRKFRFDIAILELKVAIEYEGLFAAKSRHTTSAGYTRDADKYNLAQLEGWMVLRYTAQNYKNITADIVEIQKSKR